MKNRDIINKLQSLQSLRAGGDPNPVWQREVRDTLVSMAAHDLERAPRTSPFAAQFSFARILMPYRMSHYVLRPVFVSVIVLGVAFGGFATSVSASYKSLPGDILYGVKLAAEGAQVRLAGDAQAKVELTVEFAGRRVTEVTKIIERPASAQKKVEQVKVAVKKMKDDLASVQKQIRELNDETPEKVAEVAKLVDRKTEELHNTLSKTAEKAPGDVQGAVNEAKDATVDAGVAAVAAIVKAHEGGKDTISTADVKEQMSDKITSLEQKVDGVEKSADGGVTEKTIQAKEALGAAKEFLAADNLDGALSKVIEGKDIAKEAEAFVVATKESAPPATATSTPGAPAPITPASSTPALPTGSITSTPRVP